MAVTGAILPKQYANAITWHEQNKTILSHATSVGNKLKQTEDGFFCHIQYCVHCVISIKETRLKKVHAITDLIQCIMSSDCLVFALYLNHMSHLKMFPTSYLMTNRTRNQKKFRYIIVPYGHIIVPLCVPLQICSLLGELVATYSHNRQFQLVSFVLLLLFVLY